MTEETGTDQGSESGVDGHDDTQPRVPEGNLDDSWVTLPEAASTVGVSVSALRKWYGAGEVPSRMGPGPTGPRRYVPIGAVRRRAAQTVGTVPPRPRAPQPRSYPASAAGPVPEGYALVPQGVADALMRVMDMLPAFQEAGERIGRVEAERDVYRERLDEARRAQREAEQERDRLAAEIASLGVPRSVLPTVAAASTEPRSVAPESVFESEPGMPVVEAVTPEAPPSRDVFVSGPQPARDDQRDAAAAYTETFLTAGPMAIVDSDEPDRLTAEGRRFRRFLRTTGPLRIATLPLDRLHRAVGPVVFPGLVLATLLAAGLILIAADAGPGRTWLTVVLGVVGLLGAVNLALAVLFDRLLGRAVMSTRRRRWPSASSGL